MVRGAFIAVTDEFPINQWADMERIAFGVGIIFPNARQATVYPLASRVFIGLPCPMNSTGILLISLIPSQRSEEHTSELQSLMRISSAVFCLKKKQKHQKKLRTVY